MIPIGLWQVDGKLPNLALMKISAWLKARDVETVLQRTPDEHTFYASVIFTKNRQQVEMWKNAYDFDVGGSGWDLKKTLPDNIERMQPDYDLYEIDYAMGYLHRGCIRKCAFCLVPEKEGQLSRVSTLGDLVRPDTKKLMLLDNNLTGAPDVLEILGEMADRDLEVAFTQGLDIRLMTQEIAAALFRVKYRNSGFYEKRLYFAFDNIKLEKRVRRGIEMLLDAGIHPNTLSFYVLVGFDSTFAEDVERCEILRGYGIRPYVMRYRKTPQLNALARWANANAGMWRKPFSMYDGQRKRRDVQHGQIGLMI
jgi:hypothetical protein